MSQSPKHTREFPTRRTTLTLNEEVLNYLERKALALGRQRLRRVTVSEVLGELVVSDMEASGDYDVAVSAANTMRG